MLKFSPKLFLCGITQNCADAIKELCFSAYHRVYGMIFVDGGSTDGTLDILNEYKKEGCVIQRKWTGDHDFSMNEFLRTGKMDILDWFIIRDSYERITEWGWQNIRNLVNLCVKNNIGAVSCGKMCLVRYNNDLIFLGTPHWGLNNTWNRTIDLCQITDGPFLQYKDIFYSIKKRTASESIYHYLKYYYVYGRSNHLALCYPNERQMLEQEEIRKIFRFYCRYELGLEYTCDSLICYLSQNKENLTPEIKRAINSSRILNLAYQHCVLNIDAEELTKNIKDRENWVTDIDMIKL